MIRHAHDTASTRHGKYMSRRHVHGIACTWQVTHICHGMHMAWHALKHGMVSTARTWHGTNTAWHAHGMACAETWHAHGMACAWHGKHKAWHAHGMTRTWHGMRMAWHAQDMART